MLKRIMWSLLVIALAGALLPATPLQAAGVCYVRASASGSNDGSSWVNAYTDLQSALGSSPCSEIWVAAGTYKPGTTSDRFASFRLKNDVAIYGGFGGTETARSQRNPATHESVLSGDIDNNDSQTPVITDINTVTGNTNNSLHVVFGSSGITGAILDGFTITGGNANYEFKQEYISNPNGFGGGMYNEALESTLSHLTFRGNQAAFGGGIFNSYILNLSNVTISGNRAAADSGGIFNSYILNLSNGTISGNRAGTRAGGMKNTNNYTTNLSNVTISGNQAALGGGIYIDFDSHKLTLTNVILWGNSATIAGNETYNLGSIASFNHNVMQTGGCYGLCSFSPISGDPLLGPLQNNGGFTQTMALGTGSSAIDAGTATGAPASDQRGVTRSLGTGPDIGAYEAGANILTVSSSTPAANVTLSSLSTLTVYFSENALADGSDQAANNTHNYLLVEAGGNTRFDTNSCLAGLAGDDVKQNISSAVYSAGGGSKPYQALLTLAGPLAEGSYRLFICGTTSIESAAGLELNNGASDETLDFNVSTSSSASSLPSTGFAPGRFTHLPAPPAAAAMSETDMTLEIPAMHVSAPIVGVPQAAKGWDVTWLGQKAGWLNGTAFPTWKGNSVLTGHVWDADNRPGLFADLKNLRYGDSIRVHAFGQIYTYEVRQSERINPGNVGAALKHEDQAWLTLLTCEDYAFLGNTYSGRRLVRAVLVNIQ